MNADRKTLWLVILGVATALALGVAGWQLSRALAPRPVRAWVAIEVDGSGVAEVGVVEVPAGTSCTLHAVLEAERLDGRRVYYTEAPALRIDGRDIPVQALRRWDSDGVVAIFWFTVEGVSPRLLADAGFSPDDLAFKVSFRADWPRAWAVPAILESSASSFAQGRELIDDGAFGTQRYHVRIEFYASPQALMPERRFASWGAESAVERSATFPTLVAVLPGPLAPLSRLFGLTQIDLGTDATAAVRQAIEGWSDRRLAFSRATAIRSLLDAAGMEPEQIAWVDVDLEGGWSWDAAGVAEGDLARVGERVVVLALDRGYPGVLDRDDLCIDFDRGIAVRRLGEVFAGEGRVEWGALRPVDATERSPS